nr:hypothetical protein [Saprospiraceae bacterium]
MKVLAPQIILSLYIRTYDCIHLVKKYGDFKKLSYFRPMATQSRSNKLISWIYNVLTDRVFTHLVWWVALFALILSFEEPGFNIWFRLTNALLLTVFYMAIVYFNLLYLIPEYLSQKKIFRYILLLLVSLLIATPI